MEAALLPSPTLSSALSGPAVDSVTTRGDDLNLRSIAGLLDDIGCITQITQVISRNIRVEDIYPAL